MSALEVIGIVASCVQAFHGGTELITVYKDRRRRGSERNRNAEHELFLQDMLQESMENGARQLTEQFLQDQRSLGRHSQLLREGDNTAKQELLLVAVTLQAEIIKNLGRARSDDTGEVIELTRLKSLHETAITKRNDAVRTISQLRRRIEDNVGSASRANTTLARRNSNASMAKSFVADAVDFSRRGSTARHSRRLDDASQPKSKLSSLKAQEHLIPAIKADDIDSLTLNEASPPYQQETRSTLAPQAITALESLSISAASLAAFAPEPLNLNRPGLSTAASYRAGIAPEPAKADAVDSIHESMPLEAVGPWFPPRNFSATSDQISPLTQTLNRQRPSLPTERPSPEHVQRVYRLFPNVSVPTPIASPAISEPDSILSLQNNANNANKPFCPGAIIAQEDFLAGFSRNELPVLPGSEMTELCWKCKECDFNASDSDGQLFERIEFARGIRFRFSFLARSHVPYAHPADAIKSRYNYGCIFCSAEGKKSAVFESVDVLTGHIDYKHRTNLTPHVRERTRCVVGSLAGREEDWDCNIQDIRGRKSSGSVGRWVLRAVTSLPTE